MTSQINTTRKINKDVKLDQTKSELIKVSTSFYQRGWMLGTSGNLSILIEENPLQFLITVSGKDKGELTEDDFILVNESGVIARSNSDEAISIGIASPSARNDTSSVKPSAETLLHSAIYKHVGAKAVFHVHTTNSTLLSMKSGDKIIFSDLEMLKGLGLKTHDVKITIPIIENSQDMKYLATIAPNYINEDVPGLLLKGHGIYAWGKSPQEAKRHVEIFEFLFEYRMKELALEKM
ncbi:MAG: methylthioribulose 1-phosphate dehydratase [Candidatus Melainabacteria bacterium]|nr:methylthioribulose 1-phosphate dehydratase [Candidatus Melainabacteria bacterium]